MSSIKNKYHDEICAKADRENDNGMPILNEKDEDLLRILKVELEDYERGASRFSQCDDVLISKFRYKTMIRLIFKMKDHVS